MVDRRLQNIALHLRSLEAQRQSALATGDGRLLARADQFIVQLEAQAALLAELLAGDTPPTEAERGRRQHILAVHDDPDFLNIMRTLLQDERFNVITPTTSRALSRRSPRSSRRCSSSTSRSATGPAGNCWSGCAPRP